MDDLNKLFNFADFTYGSRLKYLRTLRGVTQKQLGEVCGFTGNAVDNRIHQYEHNIRKPKSNINEKISTYLSVNPCMLSLSYTTLEENFLATLLWNFILYDWDISQIVNIASIDSPILRRELRSAINVINLYKEHQITQSEAKDAFLLWNMKKNVVTDLFDLLDRE